MKRVSICCALALSLLPLAAPAGTAPPARAALPLPPPPAPPRDGQHDFDFAFGSWRTHIRTLKNPLTASHAWTPLSGTIAVSRIWNGDAQIEELSTGAFQGITLRLYDASSRQWFLYWANSASGKLGQAMVGQFSDGRGTFYDQEPYRGREILVRNVYSDIRLDSYHFEQAFSNDGGRQWETNFIADVTRAPAGEAQAVAPLRTPATVNHGFDWQSGSWRIHMARLLDAFAEKPRWTELDGTVQVRGIWGGRANLADIEMSGRNGPLKILSLRLYDPVAQQWSLNFAHDGGGRMSVPMYGTFKNGRGEFYSHDLDDGHGVLERFAFFGITGDSSRDEEAFSTDGGKTWHPDFINWQVRAK